MVRPRGEDLRIPRLRQLRLVCSETKLLGWRTQLEYNTILSIASTSLGTRAQRLVKTKGLGNVKLVGSKQFIRATEDAQD